MAQFINWGSGKEGNLNISAANLGGIGGFGVGTFTGTAGNNYGTFSDAAYFNGGTGGRVGDLCIIHQSQGTGAGNWEIVKISKRSGTTVYFDRNLTNTYVSGAQIQSAPNLNGGTISGNLGPYTAWNGSTGGIIFIVDKGTLTVSGSIVATGSGFRGASQSGSDGSNSVGGKQGESYLGTWNTVTTAANYSSGGGGGKTGYDNGGGGGGGGHSSSGSTGGAGQASGGTGGASCGSANLTTMFFGGSGGGGSRGRNNNYNGGYGGAGGGIIVIFAKVLSVSGYITCNGGNGENTDAYYNPGAGGAGAGGSILIKCKSASLGTSGVSASAGSAGYSPDSNSGGAGSAGRIHCDYFTSVSGSTNPTLSSAQDLTLTVPSGGFFAFM